MKLVAFLKSLGVNYVFDTTFSRDFALIERYVVNPVSKVIMWNICMMFQLSAHEFVRRYKRSSNGDIPMLASACPGE